MKLKIVKPIGTMAAVVGTGVELINVDCIALVSQVINVVDHQVHFALALGGCDSKGSFHIDLHRRKEVAQVSIIRDENPAGFDQLFTGDDGFPRVNLPDDLLEQVITKAVLPVGYRNAWGAKYPDMDILLHDAPVLVARGGVIISQRVGAA